MPLWLYHSVEHEEPCKCSLPQLTNVDDSCKTLSNWQLILQFSEFVLQFCMLLSFRQLLLKKCCLLLGKLLHMELLEILNSYSLLFSLAHVTPIVYLVYGSK